MDGKRRPRDFWKEFVLRERPVMLEAVRRGFGSLGEWCRWLALSLALAAAGCQSIDPSMGDPEAFTPSNHPVTVDNVSRDNKLAALAKAQHPRILNTYGGEYSNPKLERMVAKVVGRLTVVSDNPNQTYRITILNSPNVNAFALPGGYVYVTRGLLALANDSAELAAVIAHEMGHITANHGLLRQQREQEELLASKVVNTVLGGSPEAKAALIRGKLRLAQFSRDQELQADAIGIQSIGKAGFDPYAAARFLKSMQAYADFRNVSGATDTSLDFLATHPSTPQRVALAEQHAAVFGAPGVGTRDRDAFLKGIDGMLFGDKPEEGYVRGRTFLHPGLGIAFTVPQGFVIDNTAAAVTATGPGELAVRFDGLSLDRKTSLVDYMKSGWVSGLDKSSVRAATVGGQEAAIGRAKAGSWQFDVTVIRSGDQVYRLLTAAPLASNQLEPTAQAVRDSFRMLTPAEKDSLKPLVIRIVTVKPGETVGTMAAMMHGVDRKLDLFRVLNALGPGSTVSAGDKVKIVTEK